MALFPQAGLIDVGGTLYGATSGAGAYGYRTSRNEPIGGRLELHCGLACTAIQPYSC